MTSGLVMFCNCHIRDVFCMQQLHSAREIAGCKTHFRSRCVAPFWHRGRWYNGWYTGRRPSALCLGTPPHNCLCLIQANSVSYRDAMTHADLRPTPRPPAHTPLRYIAKTVAEMAEMAARRGWGGSDFFSRRLRCFRAFAALFRAHL